MSAMGGGNLKTAVLGVLLLATGCVSLGHDGPPTANSTAVVATAQSASKTAPEAKIASVPTRQTPVRPLKSTVARVGRPAIPPAAGNVQLVGLHGSELRLLLGPPRLKRRDSSAEVWQYVARSCVLHIFFYRSLATGFYQVIHVESNDVRGDGMAPDDCLTDLLAEVREADRSS